GNVGPLVVGVHRLQPTFAIVETVERCDGRDRRSLLRGEHDVGCSHTPTDEADLPMVDLVVGLNEGHGVTDVLDLLLDEHGAFLAFTVSHAPIVESETGEPLRCKPFGEHLRVELVETLIAGIDDNDGPRAIVRHIVRAIKTRLKTRTFAVEDSLVLDHDFRPFRSYKYRVGSSAIFLGRSEEHLRHP